VELLRAVRLPRMPFAVLMIAATTGIVTAGTAAALCSANERLAPVVFLLGISGVAAALFGFGSHREPEPTGIYVGYCSAIFAILLIAWWNIGDAATGEYGTLIIESSGSCTAQRIHGTLTALGLLAATIFVTHRHFPEVVRTIYKGYIRIYGLVAAGVGWATVANAPSSTARYFGVVVVIGALALVVTAPAVRRRVLPARGAAEASAPEPDPQVVREGSSEGI
jgi:hypothetical protein